MTRKKNRPLLLWLAITWLALAIACTLLTALRLKPWPTLGVGSYAAITVFLSLITYLQYWYDKRTAQSNASKNENAARIPERNLHALALLGGWPGAVFGQQWLRHKSQKLTFQVALPFIALGHIAGLVGYTWWTLK
jgi:uncharacterized membrane protein YsdA (DUF1294 family)